MSMTTGLPGIPNSNPDHLTLEQVRQAVPPNLKNNITQSFVDQINNLVSDELIAEQIRNNFISYSMVMKEGKFKLEDYLNAIAFVSYKLMGYNNQDSYIRTFPKRYADLVAKGTSSKDVAAYVSAYARGKLVNLILEQSLVPTWVLNQHLYQEAINTQAELMRNAYSEKVRSDAANSILTHLAKPKDQNFQINMEVQESSGMNELKGMLIKLAEAQTEALSKGVSVEQIAAQPLIDVTPNKEGTENGQN